MNDTTHEEIRSRLSSPPRPRHRGIIDLIEQHLAAIQAARRNHKTWEQIGADLCPTSPLKPGTVARSVKRLETKRAGQKGISHRRKNRPSPVEKSVSQKAAEIRAIPAAASAFARKVDPIRQQDAI